MRIARLLCAIGICAPLVLSAGAAESPARQRPSAAKSTARTAPETARQAVAPALTPRRGSNTAQRETAQRDRSTENRVGSPPRGRTPARASTGPLASRRTAPRGAAAIRGPASPVVPISLSASKSAPRTSPSHKAPDRVSSIGGARVAGPGRLGGPAMGRRASDGVIDGSQVRRKF